MTPRAVVAAAGWAAACGAAWLAFAWLPSGFVPVGGLAIALAIDAWRRMRPAPARPGMPPMLNGSTAAAYAVGLLATLVFVGYQSDWLVIGTLTLAWLLKLLHIARSSRASRPTG